MKTLYILLSLFFGITFTSYSQIAINQVSADSSAALDISGNATPYKKGLLVPRVTTQDRKEMVNAAFGLFVFDTDKSMFYFYDDSTSTYDAAHWRALNPWGLNSETGDQSTSTHNVELDPNNINEVKIINRVVTVVSTSDTILLKPSGEISTTGNINSSKGKVQEYGHDLVPQGVVVMWFGEVADIPAGWALCDGNKYSIDPATGLTVTGLTSTPDLRERFIVGTGGDNPDVTGGEYSLGVGTDAGKISIPHTHDVNPDSYTTSNTEGTHLHTGTTGGPSGTYDPAVSLTTKDVASKNHTHNFTTNSGEGAHSHTVDLPSKTSSGASNTENRPPYYALAFIMKL